MCFALAYSQCHSTVTARCRCNLIGPSPAKIAEETDDPVYADRRNFYKVERWSKDGLHITDLLYAGNDLERARYSPQPKRPAPAGPIPSANAFACWPIGADRKGTCFTWPSGKVPA
jgi:hypothetical protein